MYNPSASGEPRSFLGYSVMRIASGSMAPTLPINTVIVTNRHVEPRDLSVGEVVTFLTENGTTLTHRIYAIYEDYQESGVRGFRLIGDASEFPDYNIYTANDFLGRYVASNYPIGRVLMFVHEHMWVAVVATILILTVLFGIKLRMRAKKG